MFGSGCSAFLKVLSRLCRIHDAPRLLRLAQGHLRPQRVFGIRGAEAGYALAPPPSLSHRGSRVANERSGFSGNVSKQVLNKVSRIEKRSGFVLQTLLNTPALMGLGRGRCWAAALVSLRMLKNGGMLKASLH